MSPFQISDERSLKKLISTFNISDRYSIGTGLGSEINNLKNSSTRGFLSFPILIIACSILSKIKSSTTFPFGLR